MEEKDIKFIKTKSYTVVNDNLGTGACGKTVLLKDNSLEELFVCKKYSPIKNVDITYFYEMFKNEIKIMYKLNHPNIVRVYNYYLYDEQQTGYILMEYIEGQTIDKYFNSDEYFVSSCDENSIFLQLLSAFCCLEKNNIIHRDIRPANIMIDKNEQVKIIDFGLGKDFSKTSLSKDSLNNVINRLGMEKIPQEMVDGKYDFKTDMFCIGELYCRILKKNGTKTFKYANILNKMTEIDPRKRFDSFQSIIDIINKREFYLLDITENDKEVYKEIADFIYYNISSYNKVFKFEDDIDSVLQGLEELLENNYFETFLIGNNNLFSVFVKNGYKYRSSSQITISAIRDFYNWLKDKDVNFQSVVLKNLKSKLSNIDIEREDNQLPF